jgi:hypothetical protein
VKAGPAAGAECRPLFCSNWSWQGLHQNRCQVHPNRGKAVGAQIDRRRCSADPMPLRGTLESAGARIDVPSTTVAPYGMTSPRPIGNVSLGRSGKTSSRRRYQFKFGVSLVSRAAEVRTKGFTGPAAARPTDAAGQHPLGGSDPLRPSSHQIASAQISRDFELRRLRRARTVVDIQVPVAYPGLTRSLRSD